ncbi:uncharacterized protein LOC129568909 [Sitodiplosis mosellana]|uniref:uncharacterized protein LOC129568909 n=1 Tax=Sitodiplosis mosellana TaxID=263140 RepID=UPI002444A7AB|nr:uncharacterized protein LOC129568909 [Sitodiplosis mosellana]
MLSRRSFTLLLFGLVVSQFLFGNVSGAPFANQHDDHYDSSPTFVPVKDRVKAIDDHAKKNGWVPLTKSPSFKAKAKHHEPVKATEPVSEPDHNNSPPVSIKERAKAIDGLANKNGGEHLSNSPSLKAKAKKQGWVDLWNPESGPKKINRN